MQGSRHGLVLSLLCQGVAFGCGGGETDLDVTSFTSACDPSRSLIVAERGSKELSRIRSDGTIELLYRGFTDPIDLVLDGEVAWVADRIRSDAGVLIGFDLDGAGIRERVDLPFAPTALAFDGAGTWWIGSASGPWRRRSPDHLLEPMFADDSVIQAFAAHEGAWYTVARRAPAPARLIRFEDTPVTVRQLHGEVVDLLSSRTPDGTPRLLAAERDTHRVRSIDVAGARDHIHASGLDHLGGLANGCDGRSFASRELPEGSIWQLDRFGVAVEWIAPTTELDRPHAIAWGAR